MRLTIIVTIIVALIGLGFVLYRPTSLTSENSEMVASPTASTPQENTSFQAAFLIFTNGTKRDFSSSRYHDLNSKVYLTADTPNIIQVSGSGITWQYFFDTLPMQLSAECLVTGTNQRLCTGSGGRLKFYLNGTEDQQALSRIIMPGDQLLVSYGNETEAEIDKQLLQTPIPSN